MINYILINGDIYDVISYFYEHDSVAIRVNTNQYDKIINYIGKRIDLYTDEQIFYDAIAVSVDVEEDFVCLHLSYNYFRFVDNNNLIKNKIRELKLKTIL